MPKVAIVTDTTAGIPEDILEELNIHTVTFYIHRGEELLLDLVNIQREEFFAWLPTAEELPKTSHPSPGDYYAAFEKLHKEKGVREIVSIQMSSGMSGAYQAALSAKAMVEERLPDLRVEVVDTKQIMMCQGWVVIEAARAAQEGKPLSEIVSLAKSIAPRACMIQTADTLRYLYMGGRIGKASSLFGTMLNIKPIVGMEDGIIVPLGKARSRGKAYVTMADLVEQAVGKMGKIKAAYVHAAAREAAQQIRELVEARVDCVETIFAEHSPALSVHTGPGTAGICYYAVESE